MLIIVIMPKRMNWREIYLTFGFIAGLVWSVDTIFAGWFDLFDIGKPKEVGIAEFFLFSVIPSCFAVIYLNFYQERNKILYPLLFTALSELAEWVTVAVGIMKLNQWNPLYSLPVYLFVYYFFLPKHKSIMERTTTSPFR
ncbi:hypothetical protein [Paenibacillus sp.]|uniref:hypothetical protein n=1 Tax=Paenibacillus sp. TaxID=58172 RepID=UPI002811D613|nr:hypothetical protein [Paenibacillus sp.]